jgi:uncharacterized protein (TIGR03083 family)
MESPGFDPLQAIADHSAGFAAAVDGNFGAQVKHCPEWKVGDLVRHLTEVHWFWATITEERLAAPPDEERRPVTPPDDELLDVFRAGADRLVAVLRAADGGDKVWTWAPAQQDVAFVTRHQVQEAAVHHWDAVDAAGGSLAIEPPVAADSVDEFLTFSVSSDADPADPPRPPLAGSFGLLCTDTDRAWTVSDGKVAGTVAISHGVEGGLASIDASASDLLLWLYGRVDLDTAPVEPELLERFRALSFTD